MSSHSEAQLDRRFVEFVKLLNVYLNHFPKAEKYGLAQQIRSAAYDVYGLIVEAQKRYQKKTTLTSLDIRHEQLRMFVRLAHELGYFEFKGGARDQAPERLAARRYLALSKRIDELGRMIGGWIVADRAKPATREAP
ncbi:23S rRNA-intervening sequence protein [compost metagenome]